MRCNIERFTPLGGSPARRQGNVSSNVNAVDPRHQSRSIFRSSKLRARALSVSRSVGQKEKKTFHSVELRFFPIEDELVQFVAG